MALPSPVSHAQDRAVSPYSRTSERLVSRTISTSSSSAPIVRFFSCSSTSHRARSCAQIEDDGMIFDD